MALQLLDTSALIDLSKGSEPTTTWLKQQSAAGEELGICPITVTEFYSGLEAVEYPQWDEFFATLTFCPISFNAAIQAGKWRASFRARGIQLSTTDTLIAAVAVEIGAVVVTSNTRHYPMQVRLTDPRVMSSS
jgi:predicted nucleic acid-binding protein